MKKYLITDAGVLRTENGNDVAFLNVANQKLRVFRSLEQIKTDLGNSGLLNASLADTVFSVRDPRIAGVMPDLVGGHVFANMIVRKAGDEYTVDETSGVMQPTHPEFGNYAIGDIAKVENDHLRIEGFLRLRRDPEIELTIRTARERANLMAELAGLFGAPTSDATGVVDGNAVAETQQIPDDVAEEAGVEVPASEEKA